MTIKQALSETLIDAIHTARQNGGELVRLPMQRGCWTIRVAVPSGKGWPLWWVTDNTVHALLRRGIAVVTHTRDGDRPAVVRVKSEEEMAPKAQVVELTNGQATVRLFDRSQNAFVDVTIMAGERGVAVRACTSQQHHEAA